MKKYQVKQGDTLPKIAAQFNTTIKALRDLNKVNSVSRGQELNVPSEPPNPYAPPMLGQFLPPLFTTPPVQLPTNAQSMAQGYNLPSPQRTYMEQFPSQGTVKTVTQFPTRLVPQFPAISVPQFGIPFQTPATPRPTQPIYNNIQPAATLPQYIPPATTPRPTQPIYNNIQPAATLPQYNPNIPPAMRPAGNITSENYGQWVNYWNYEASKPQGATTPPAPVVMTKAQIWNMKAAQRRRKQEQEAVDLQQQNQYAPFFTGNAVSNLALRTG